METIVETFLKLWNILVQAGFAPIDIVLVIVTIALYVKSEELDRKLHDCLAETQPVKAAREAQELTDRMDKYN